LAWNVAVNFALLSFRRYPELQGVCFGRKTMSWRHSGHFEREFPASGGNAENNCYPVSIQRSFRLWSAGRLRLASLVETFVLGTQNNYSQAMEAGGQQRNIPDSAMRKKAIARGFSPEPFLLRALLPMVSIKRLIAAITTDIISSTQRKALQARGATT
jgi:hypothetical protein